MVESGKKGIPFLPVAFSMFRRQIYDICHKIGYTIKFIAVHYCSAILRTQTGKTCFCYIRHLYYPITNVASIRAAQDLSHYQTHFRLLMESIISST
jgi:hypothetical protein